MINEQDKTIRCGCGRVWDIVHEWPTLEYCGTVGEGDEKIELRHCVCLSTISIPFDWDDRPENEIKEGVADVF